MISSKPRSDTENIAMTYQRRIIYHKCQSKVKVASQNLNRNTKIENMFEGAESYKIYKSIVSSEQYRSYATVKNKNCKLRRGKFSIKDK